MKKVVNITYFVHGTTIDNEKGIASGWADAKLSELGKNQSTELKGLIKNKKFDVVFCSDLKRAADSANLTFKDNVKIIQDKRLRECNYGDLTRADSKKVESLTLKHIDKPFPNGESYKDVEKRIKDFLEDLLKKYSEKNVAIVAHKAPQLALDVLLKGKTWEKAIKEDWRLKQPPEWKPGWEYVLEGEKEYHGIIVDKSLKNKKSIDKLNVIGSKKSSSNDWTLLKISFPENRLNEIIKFVQENLISKERYYAHFYRDDELIVIFKDKIFHVTPEKSTWKPAIEYGLSLNIPREQMDMKPCRFEDETY